MKWICKICIVLLLFLSSKRTVHAQDTPLILISDINIQIEATQALNNLYNFKFEKAEQQFRWFKQKHAWHPLPYFLLGLSEWWKIMPNTRNTSYDDSFLAYMDSAIFVAKHLYKKSPEYRIEAAFFMAAAYGFKGRLYAESSRNKWGKAAAAGKAALRHLNESKTTKQLSPELLFGDALYNYFTVWVPENYPVTKPLLWFFPKGDKQLGLAQLTEVSYNAFYTRTEAMVWLMRILSQYENKPGKALQIAEYLHETYPDNPYFHRYYARILYINGHLDPAEEQSKKILNRIDSGVVGYEANSGRYASYYLGRLYQMRGNVDSTKKYYLLMATYARAIGDTDSGYYLHVLLKLGDIHTKQGEESAAINCFTRAIKGSRRGSATFKEATKKLKELKKGKK